MRAQNEGSVTLSAGARLGPYEIVAPVGAGGMGEVYKARDTRLDRTVAIKLLAPHLSADAAVKERFEREARAISSLNHPHMPGCRPTGRRSPFTSSSRPRTTSGPTTWNAARSRASPSNPTTRRRPGHLMAAA